MGVLVFFETLLGIRFVFSMFGSFDASAMSTKLVCIRLCIELLMLVMECYAVCVYY